MNLDYSLSDLAKISHGTLLTEKDIVFHSVFIDSRNYFDANTSVFFAIKGKHNDGHDYLVELYEKGLRNFVVNRSSHNHLLSKLRLGKKKKKLDFSDARIIVVEDTLIAFQALAAHHRKRYNIPVIAITGSNGKTIVKEWLYHFLRGKYNTVRSPKSYNSQVGVPLSVLQLNAKHTLAIFEAGISHKGEMEKLERIIAPTHGILTNIGESHLENFKDAVELKKEKCKLFAHCKYLSFEEKEHDKSFSFLRSEIAGKTTKVVLSYKGEELVFVLPFVDQASINNAITCILFLLEFGMDSSELIEKAKTLFPIAFRLESRRGKNNSVIIDDFYNSDLGSLRIALDFLDRNDAKKKKCLILSDFKSDGINANELYREIALIVNARKLDSFIGIGSQMIKHRHFFDSGYFYENTKQYLSNIEEMPESVVLVKGTHEFQFEQISSFLEEKTHETILKVNLKALVENINTYRSFLKPSVMLLAMVKAFGYGAGIREIVLALQHAKVNYLGVAYTDEGIQVREEGVELPIIVMNAERGSFEDIVKNNLEPVIFSLSQLDDFIKKLIGLGVKNYPIHIKLDTGMNRLGFKPTQIEELVAAILSQPEVRVKSIFTHLAASDDAREDEFTQGQILQFEQVANIIEDELGYNCLKHVLNSAGIERFKEAQFDMVRLGLGMYGVSDELSLKVVGSLTTVVAQIKDVQKGESISYGRSQFAEKDMKIAVLPIGYADGFCRNLSNGKGHVLIQNRLVPTVGRVCMDMVMVDVTNLEVKEGDLVEIFGEKRKIKNLAKEMQTIPYEVMTSVSQRVVRVYIED